MSKSSSEMTEQFQHWREIQNDFRPRLEIAESLGSKVLVNLVGISHVGKTTLANAAVRLDPRGETGRVKIFTSREPKPTDEPAYFEYLDTREKLLDLSKDIDTERIVNFTIHPTLMQVYGTRPESYVAKYNLLETLAEKVDYFRGLPFKEVMPVTVIREPAVWEQAFTRTHPSTDPNGLKRLNEGEASLQWSLSQENDHYWLVNREGEVEETARQLLDLMKHGAHVPDKEAKAFAIQTLNRIQTLKKQYIS